MINGHSLTLDDEGERNLRSGRWQYLAGLPTISCYLPDRNLLVSPEHGEGLAGGVDLTQVQVDDEQLRL